MKLNDMIGMVSATETANRTVKDRLTVGLLRDSDLHAVAEWAKTRPLMGFIGCDDYKAGELARK